MSGRSRMLRLVVGLVLLAGLLVATPLSVPSALAAGRPSVTPAKPMRGEQFTVAGTFGGKVARPVQLQVRSGHDWKSLGQPGTTDATGRYRLTGTATGKSLTVRVLAPAQSGLARATTAARRVATVGQSGKLSMTRSAYVNQTVTVTLTFTPARAGREVRLQVRQGSLWTDLGATGMESAKGKAVIRVNAAAAGTFTYRGQAVPWHGAAAATTGSRKLTIKPDAVVVDPDARPLTSAEVARITSYSAGTGTLILTGPPASARTITAGDILPIPPRAGIASGALRRVTAVSSKGSTMTVRTTVANLPDAITNVPDSAADIALSVLTPGTFQPVAGVTVDAQPARPRTGGRLNPAETGVTIPVGSPISLTLDMTLKSGAFSGALKGKVVLQPYLRMAFDTDWGNVVSYKLGAGVVSTSSVTFQAAVTAMSKATVSLGRISQIMTGAIGAVPVWVQDDLELVAELSASGSIKVSSVWRGSYEAGVKGSRGDTEPQIYTGGDPITGEIGDFAAAITLTDFIGPQVQLSIYSLVGPYVRVGVLARGTISFDALKGFSCKLQVGPHLEAGIKTSAGLEKLTGIAYSTKFGIDFAVAEKEYCPDGTNGGGTGGGGGGGGGGTTALAVTTTSLPEATVGTAYNADVAHTGGTAPYSWAAAGLPDGLSINQSNGVITGVPTKAGITSVEFTVTDGSTPAATATASLVLQVNPTASRKAVQVSAGNRFSCALTHGGAVQCWGGNNYGQLGNNGLDDSAVPVQVVGLETGVKQIASSEAATCAITGTGTVECWGSGITGGTGQGQADLADHRTPVAVTAVGDSVTAISGNGSHFCALKAGAVYCWGDNWYGEVNGVPEDQFAHSKVIGPVHIPGVSGATAITAGSGHNCAIVAAEVRCWGSNASAELGTGEAGDTVANPVVATVLGATQVSQVLAGAGYTCVVTTGHAARCWGNTDSHRLGTDIDTGGLAYTATPVTVDGLGSTASMLGVKGINACAVTTAGAVTCWGSVATGDFTIPNYLPTEALSSGISLVGPGVHHSCAVTRLGGVTCWGLNWNHQLGADDTDANGPIEVPAFG